MKKIIAFLLVMFSFPAWVLAFSAQAELDFYKKELNAFPVENTREHRAFAQSLATDLDGWIRRNPTNAAVQDALLMQARLYLRAQKPGAAVVALFKLRREFPTVSAQALKPILTEAVQQGLDKDSQTKAIQLFSSALPTAETAATARQADALYQLSKLSGKTFYEPAQSAFENFFVQYPTYEKNNEVELWYGDLHRMNGNYLAAIFQYRKAGDLYEENTYKAASLRLAGDIYADNLKDTAAAMEMYSRVLHEFPNSSEIGIVYKHMAILDENNKQYESALINYDKAIEKLGTSLEAYEAYLGKAEVMEKNKDYENAYQQFTRTGKLYAAFPQQAANAYEKAAEIAAKRLRDSARYTQSLEKVLLVYPSNPQAPKLMYELASSYEKQGKNTQALASYKQLVLKYPADKYANKAQGRIAKLSK